MYSREEIFTKLSGIWRYVDSSGVNYAMRVYVTINNNTNTNTYSYIAETWDEAESSFSY